MPVLYNDNIVSKIKFIDKNSTEKNIRIMFFNGVKVFDNSPNYFYVENTSQNDGTFYFASEKYDGSLYVGGGSDLNIYYSKDKANWTKCNWESMSFNSEVIRIKSGEKIYFKGDNDHFGRKYQPPIEGADIVNVVIRLSSFDSSCITKIGGNIITLIDSTGNSKIIPSDFCFAKTFSELLNLTDISDLVIDVNECTSFCFAKMFSGCTNINTFPNNMIIRGNGIGSICEYMFYGCINIPNNINLNFNEYILPEDTSVSGSFAHMFDIDSLISYTYLRKINFNIKNVSNGILNGNLYQFVRNSSTSGIVIDIHFNITEKVSSSAMKQIGSYYYTSTVKLHFYPYLIKFIDAFGTAGGTTSSPGEGYYCVYFHYEENDMVKMDATGMLTKGNNKNTMTYDIYTNNTIIKNGVISQRDSYTIVNVFHLDGTPW